MNKIQLDATRWRKVRDLSGMEIKTMTPAMKAAWDRLLRGGWYTGDLEELIDALPEPVENLIEKNIHNKHFTV